LCSLPIINVQKGIKVRESYIEQVYAKNFRQFEELDVKFNKGFNFITGPNGSGKTSILACIAHCLNHSNYRYSRFRENSEIWTNITTPKGKYKIGVGAGSIKIGGYRGDSIQQWANMPTEADRTNVNSAQINNIEGFCPLFLGSNRSIKYKQISGMQREKPRQESSSTYNSQNTQSLYGEKPESIKQWFINRYFIIEKGWAAEEKLNWEHMITSLPELGPFESDLKYVRTERDLEPIFSIYGEECYLEELSSGFQAVLFVIASIFEWLETTKPEGQRQAVSAVGTVLIDELDVHLHPEWQLTLRNGLRTMFPNLQFITTTHSPHLLASAQEGEVIVLPRTHGLKKYKLEPTNKKYSGWNTDQILTDLMDVRSLENKDYERLISEAFDACEQKNVDTLELAITNLDNITHPNDSIMVVLKTRLASLRVLQP